VEQQIAGKIVPGLKLYFFGGRKLGTVAHVHLTDRMRTRKEDTAHEGVVEVKTGLLGLGKRLYVPLETVAEVLDDAAFLAQSWKDADPHWDHKPAHL